MLPALYLNQTPRLRFFIRPGLHRQSEGNKFDLSVLDNDTNFTEPCGASNLVYIVVDLEVLWFSEALLWWFRGCASHLVVRCGR
jgi:hypothetical protein